MRSQSTEILSSVAWGHIYFCDTARNRMCLLNPTLASLTQYCCSLQQWWEEIQEQRRKRKEKSCVIVNWGHILVPNYTWHIILAFFPVFNSSVCILTVAKACWLSWSTGECWFQANLRCICLEDCPGYKSRLTPAEFVQSQSGYQ